MQVDAPRGKLLENLDCLGLHFASFHGGEREEVNRCSVWSFEKKNTGLKIYG